MHPCVFIIFSFLLLLLETATADQLVAVEAVNKNCSDVERRALLDFKAGLQDPKGALSTWTTEDHDCCSWPGVTCDIRAGHNHVTWVDMANNNLHGTIPKSIGSLTKLEYLYLSKNSFYGTIPPEFGNLTNLQFLLLDDVGICRVENSEWLSHLSHLEALYMDGVSLAKADNWVDVISSLPKLTDLSLDGCELSHVKYLNSSFLNSSSCIKYLSLKNNNLTSSMYRWLVKLTNNNLLDLDISSNRLDGIPTYFGNLCNLYTLVFENNFVAVKFSDFLNNLSGCTTLTLQSLVASKSRFIGSLSDNIQKFSSLRFLYLSHNQLDGTISEKLWELSSLEHLYISSNYLRGAISKNIGKSKSYVIYLSENPLEGVPSTAHMSNLSYVTDISLRSCKLGPHFPKWIQKLEKVSDLDISNTGISDTVPQEFWNMKLQHLNLSFNNIRGEVPDLSSNFFDSLDLSSNSFNGLIPNLPSGLELLNLSKNKFYGGISFLCQIDDGYLRFLDLSYNDLTGPLPNCLSNFKELQVLNLGNNNLSGRVPPSIGSLIILETLHLYKNNFYGELPLSLKNCTRLNLLNLGANNFSGNVPLYIGENLSELYAVILGSNNFFGTIPLQLCQLANLQILDLSRNHLYGTIPSCLKQGLLPPSNIHPFIVQGRYAMDYVAYIINYEYVDHAMIEWKGNEYEFLKNLGSLKSIDLSSNNLT